MEAPTPVELVHGDAIDACRTLARPFDLVYLDPPFNVGGRFTARTRAGERRGRAVAASGPDAYGDAWGGIEGFLAMLEPRLAAVRDCLSPHATLWLHLDQRTVHEAKGVCDRLFGRGAFRGEVIWVPGNGARRSRGPAMTHQTLLVYTRDARAEGAFTWNDDDPAMREPFAETSRARHFHHVDADGRRYRERVIAGKAYRYYEDVGRRLGSVWTDCPAMVANTPLCAEATGYPTQKPEKLLERIVRASSAPGDTVADLMCGSGTTLVVAARLGRRAVGGDASPRAIATTTERLERAGVPCRARAADALSARP